MSNNKSRKLERKAGGWRVFFVKNSSEKGVIPDYLMNAINQCVENKTLSPKTIETSERLGELLSRLANRPSIGIEFGLASNEINELISLWNRLTDNGTRPRPHDLLPRKYPRKFPRRL